MYQTKDLFQVQSELVDAKVEIAVSRASDRIIERIENLRSEVHELKHDITERLSAVETRLGMRNETREQIRNRFIEYAFKVGSLALAAIVSAIVSGVVLYLHHL
jgi:hypothetical protein